MPDTTLTDPLGRSITLHDRTWYGHILRRHPEMARHRALVEETVRKPIEIRVSTYDPDCRTCYGAGWRSGILVAVVIDVMNGLVRTAFPTTRARGVLEWSRPTP